MWVRWKDGREPACSLLGNSGKHKHRRQSFHQTARVHSILMLQHGYVDSFGFVRPMARHYVFGKDGNYVMEYRLLSKHCGALGLDLDESPRTVCMRACDLFADAKR